MYKLAVIGCLTVLGLTGCSMITPQTNSTLNTNEAHTSASSTATSTPSCPTPVVTAPTTQVYHFLYYNFEFSYPLEFGFTTPNYGFLKEKLVQLELPTEAYPGKIDFGDAAFTVGWDWANSLDECLQNTVPDAPGHIRGFNTKEIINGVTFYRADSGEGAAGNSYSSRSYRTLRKDTCIEITETLHTTPAAVDPSTDKSKLINEDEVWGRLDAILKTFKFNS